MAVQLLIAAVLAIVWCVVAGDIPLSLEASKEILLPASGSLAVAGSLLWTGFMTTSLTQFWETLAMKQVSERSFVRYSRQRSDPFKLRNVCCNMIILPVVQGGDFPLSNLNGGDENLSYRVIHCLEGITGAPPAEHIWNTNATRRPVCRPVLSTQGPGVCNSRLIYVDVVDT